MSKKTRQVLAEILTENTGRHFLDSGGAYGRNWERNQGRDFESEKASELHFGKYGIEISHNVYHWLAERLEYDEKMDKLFHRWAHFLSNEDKGWMELMNEFTQKRGGRGFYGDGEPVTINTYNGEDLLSQTLQFTYWTDDEGDFVLLQIHGGCDVRGGYTAPRVFRCLDECGIFDNARAGVWCDKCEANWSTDDAYHYYYQGCCSSDNEPFELQNYTLISDEEYGEAEEGELPPREYNVETGELLGTEKSLFDDSVEEYIYEIKDVIPAGVKGMILYNEDGEGYCPICGKGKLYPSYY